MENQKMITSRGTDAMITCIYKSGGTFQVIIGNIVPKQEYERYDLGDFIVKSGTKVNLDNFRSSLLKSLYEQYGLKDIDCFNVVVYSRSEIKKNLIVLEKRMHERLLKPTEESKENFFIQLIILKEFNGFKRFGSLNDCYGFLNEDDNHLVTFCDANAHILFSLSEEDKAEHQCKFGCALWAQKNSNDFGSYPVRKISRIKLNRVQRWQIQSDLDEFFSLDETKLLITLTRQRQIGLLNSI